MKKTIDNLKGIYGLIFAIFDKWLKYLNKHESESKRWVTIMSFFLGICLVVIALGVVTLISFLVFVAHSSISITLG